MADRMAKAPAIFKASAIFKAPAIFKASALVGVVLALAPVAASAKATRFWNLTANTVTSLQLAPAGSAAWGPNQTLNDRDRTVDHDERLTITDTAAGLYDVKLTDQTGRTCVVRNVEVKTGAVFAIEEKALKECTR